MKPILFSTAMVKSLLNGSKTQTRRTIKPQPLFQDNAILARTKDVKKWMVEAKCPYGKVGDILWVRESFKYIGNTSYKDLMADGYFVYKAGAENEWNKWKPSIHMPKIACRLFLIITEIRIENAHDISESDAMAEGILFYDSDMGLSRQFKDYVEDASGYGHPDHDYPSVSTAKESFKTLWESINGEESWKSNPHVWVVKFEQIEKPENF